MILSQFCMFISLDLCCCSQAVEQAIGVRKAEALEEENKKKAEKQAEKEEYAKQKAAQKELEEMKKAMQKAEEDRILAAEIEDATRKAQMVPVCLSRQLICHSEESRMCAYG